MSSLTHHLLSGCDTICNRSSPRSIDIVYTEDISRGLDIWWGEVYEWSVICGWLYRDPFLALRALQPWQTQTHLFSLTSREREGKGSRGVATNVPLSHYEHTINLSHCYFNLYGHFKKQPKSVFGDLGFFLIPNTIQNLQLGGLVLVFSTQIYAFLFHSGQMSNTLWALEHEIKPPIIPPKSLGFDYGSLLGSKNSIMG